jgi:DNA polymerase-1
MADLRRSLAELVGPTDHERPADEAETVTPARSRGITVRDATGDGTQGRAPVPFDRAPHLVFFLHDEVIVHTPAEYADEVAAALRASAVRATRLLFGAFPLDIPLDVSIVASYADAD